MLASESIANPPPNAEVDTAVISFPPILTSTILCPKKSSRKNSLVNDDVMSTGPGNPGKLLATDTSLITFPSRV